MATPQVPPPSAEELEAVLAHLLVNNNETIKAAEERLKEITKLPASTGALLERAGSSQHPEVGKRKREREKEGGRKEGKEWERFLGRGRG
eukprot:2740878-Rhodomonas_salina.1